MKERSERGGRIRSARTCLPGVLLLALLGAPLAVMPASQAGAAPGSRAVAAPTRTAAVPAGKSAPVVTTDAKHDTSPVLRTMRRPAVSPSPATPRVVPKPPVPHPRKAGHGKAGSAAVQTGGVTGTMPSFEQNFDGVSNGDNPKIVLPPDTQGDVGLNNYVQMVNDSFAVFDKQGNLQLGPVPSTTLWQDFGAPCETVNGSDPITMYDEVANRWFMSLIVNPLLAPNVDGYHECIAVSQTSDPLGAWFRYDFTFSAPDTLNDYPKFGVWNDAYYSSVNEFADNGQTFSGVSVQAYERDKMLQGLPARLVTIHIGDSSGVYGSLLPADAEGGALGLSPPPGAPDSFVMTDDDANGFSPTDRILMWDFHVDWNTPANSTFGVGSTHTPNRFFETQPFDSNMCNFELSCIPQPGTTAGLDAESDRLLSRAAYRNFGDHQSIALNQTVDVDGSDHAGIRWYQLDDAGSGWSLAQQGTYAPDSDNRWMGSAALDASGDMAVGYSVSGASTFPSIRVAGRLVGDPPGQLTQGETTLIEGGGAQVSPLSRWGDYSAMQVDPTDGCTFWYTNEYYAQTGGSGGDWHTRIGSFRFPSCTAGAHGTLSGTITNANGGAPVADATVSTSLASTTTDANGRYSLVLPAGSYDLTISAADFNATTVAGVEVDDRATTTRDVALDPVPSAHVTGTVTDGSGHGYPLYARIDILGHPDILGRRAGPIWTDPVTGRYGVELPANASYTAKVTAMLPGYQVRTDTIELGSDDLTHDVALPVLPACTAPGYHPGTFTPFFTEPFDGTTMPPGWTVSDALGNGQVWRFDDPGARGNLTGGQGNFAILDSQQFGPGQGQDSSLVSPAIDLSAVRGPILRFHTDYFVQLGVNQIADVDLSVDDGTTWSNIWHRTSANLRGPDLEQLAIPQAEGRSAVRARFHFSFTPRSGTQTGRWWQVDDVSVLGNQTCDPTPGGLLVGTVSDKNTGQGVDAATVASGDNPAETATTVATPDDPNVSDGFYQMFSSLTGAHPFTAAKGRIYQPLTSPVDVAADGTTRADFTLNAGRLHITPTTVTSSVVLGSTIKTTFTVQNTGTAPADIALDERTGSFQVRGGPAAPAAGTAAVGAAGTWSAIAPYPIPISESSAGLIDGKLYSAGGADRTGPTANAYAYDPATDGWTQIDSLAGPRVDAQSGVIGRTLYVSGGSDGSGLVARTEAFDVLTGLWRTVAPNPAPAAMGGSAVADGKLYVVGGCSANSCLGADGVTTGVMRYDPANNTWQRLAPYPEPIESQSCGGIGGRVYCAGGQIGTTPLRDAFVYDPATNTWSPIAPMPTSLRFASASAANGQLLMSGGLAGSTTDPSSQGFAYDPKADAWSALPDAQFARRGGAGACGFYKVGGTDLSNLPQPDSEHLSGFDQCAGTDVPWLAETPTSTTLQPGQSATVTLTLTATPADGVTQPGDATAQLGIDNSTPYPVDPIDVDLTVTPPKDWGEITGTVSGTDCHGSTAPLPAAQVQADGAAGSFSLSLTTDVSGRYTFWGPQGSDPFTVIASRDAWIAQSQTVKLKQGTTITVDFDLHPRTC